MSGDRDDAVADEPSHDDAENPTEPDTGPTTAPARRTPLLSRLRRPGRPTRGSLLRLAGYVAVWVVVSLAVAVLIFTHSHRSLSIASHDADVSPNFSGQVVLDAGPVLPDFRLDSGSRIGLDIELGKTDVESTDALIQRYALLASQPDGQVAKVQSAITGMALDALRRGAVIGLVPILLWLMLGRRRRHVLLRGLPTVRGGVTLLLVAAMVAAVWAPWDDNDDETLDQGLDWQSLGDFLGPDVPLPDELPAVEVRADVTTAGTRRLIESAVSTYQSSIEFYDTAAEQAEELELHEPSEDQTVVVLVSDRHDNIGMDRVARAVGDAGGASEVFDAGDDTSTGSNWEAFSLDSVNAAFEDYDERWGVAGNHDNGTFVANYLTKLGWTMLDGDVIDGPAGGRLLGTADPRASGLGNWRDETGLSFSEVEERIADAACAADEDGDRINTILVHDANLGRTALARGCADLVVGGHTHVEAGPTLVAGDNGTSGYTYTIGTTGGAAYAIAIGSKLRRAATITLLTYGDDGVPVGLQSVTVQTNGRIDVGDYQELDGIG